MEKLNIGYLAALISEEQYIGAIMVTDQLSIPLEFKYTDPIKPSKIHRIIFGKVLETYIIEEVIKKNLLKEIKINLSILLVNDPKLLNFDPAQKFPLMCLQETTITPLERAGEIQRIKDKEILFQTLANKNPLKITFASPELEIQERLLILLKSVINQIDIYEPFFRVETALKTICQTKN
jgi:hypothetical protein